MIAGRWMPWGSPRHRLPRRSLYSENPRFFVRLLRPCTVGDGVQVIDDSATGRYLQLHESSVGQGRFLKFVPASGAASRMFQSLLQIYYVPQFLEVEELHRKASRGVSMACEFLRFVEAIDRFPFLDDLRQVVARDGLAMDNLIAECRYRTHSGLSFDQPRPELWALFPRGS